MPLSSPFITSPAQARKRPRSLSRIAVALATAGLFNTAHATYPGENGVIVFEQYTNQLVYVIGKVSPGDSTVTTLAAGTRPSVSPNGKKIAFRSSDETSLYVMNMDGSNVVQVYDGTATQLKVSAPTWLPDGSKVAYVRLSSPRQLWATNPDGTGSAFLHNFYYADYYDRLSASPQGDRYVLGGKYGPGIRVTDAGDPSNASTAYTGQDPSWAPDGASILFHSGSETTLMEAYLDGSPPRNIPLNGDTTGGISAISPDGEFISGNFSTPVTNPRQEIRARSGTPTTFSWPIFTNKTDWSRVPKNCYTTTPQGGGGVLAGNVDFYASQCAIAVMPDGGAHGTLQQAIAIGPDQRLYHRALISTIIGDPPIWTGFTPVPGGGGNPNGINAKKIAIAAAKDGSAQVVIINANDNLVYHAMRYVNGTWSGFNLLDGAGGAPNFAARDVAITINASTPTSPGNAQVIANGLSAASVYHRVRWAAGNWTPFAQVPGAVGMNTHALAIAAGEDGNTNILATTTAADGSQGRMQQVLRDANSNWSEWVTVGTPKGTTFSASSDVAVTRTLSGTAQMMFTDAAGNAYYQERNTPNVPSSWQPQVSSTMIANTVGREVSISAGASAGSSSQLLLTRTFPQ